RPTQALSQSERTKPDLAGDRRLREPLHASARPGIRRLCGDRASDTAVRPADQPDDCAQPLARPAGNPKTVAQSRPQALLPPQNPKGQVHPDGKTGPD